MTKPATLKYTWAPYVETIQVDGECVVIQAEKYTTTRLNQTGGWIWSQLQEPQTVSDLVEKLVENFNVPKEQAEADINDFLQEIQRVELIMTV